MEITKESFKHCELVKISGRVDSQTAPQLDAVLTELLEAGQYKLVLDMGALEFVSSAGLRVLISTQKACKQLNRGAVVLADVPERIHEALDMAGFLPLFEIYEDVLHAVASF